MNNTKTWDPLSQQLPGWFRGVQGRGSGLGGPAPRLRGGTRVHMCSVRCESLKRDLFSRRVAAEPRSTERILASYLPRLGWLSWQRATGRKALAPLSPGKQQGVASRARRNLVQSADDQPWIGAPMFLSTQSARRSLSIPVSINLQGARRRQAR